MCYYDAIKTNLVCITESLEQAIFFILLIFATRAGSPQQHVPITVGL